MLEQTVRGTGKTTQMLECVAGLLSLGARVLVVCLNQQLCFQLRKRLAENPTLDFSALQQVRFVAVNNLENIRGDSFDHVFSDPGELEPCELVHIKIRSEVKNPAHKEQHARRKLSSR